MLWKTGFVPQPIDFGTMGSWFVIQPIGFETMGSWGVGAKAFLSDAANRMRQATDNTRGVEFLRQ